MPNQPSSRSPSSEKDDFSDPRELSQVLVNFSLLGFFSPPGAAFLFPGRLLALGDVYYDDPIPVCLGLSHSHDAGLLGPNPGQFQENWKSGSPCVSREPAPAKESSFINVPAFEVKTEAEEEEVSFAQAGE